MSTLSRFERLTLPHMGAAFNLAFWLSRSRPDAEDIVQEAFLRAFRSFDGFRGEDVRPWLLAIVRNAAYRWLTDRQRAGNVVSLEESLAGHGDENLQPYEAASEEPSAEQMLVGAAERDYVRRALAELPPAFREVLVLREIEGLSYREIAEVIGTRVGTVMSRLARGRRELRKTLTQLIEKDEPNAL